MTTRPREYRNHTADQLVAIYETNAVIMAGSRNPSQYHRVYFDNLEIRKEGELRGLGGIIGLRNAARKERAAAFKKLPKE